MLFEESEEVSQIERFMCLFGPPGGIQYGGRDWCRSGTYYSLPDQVEAITEQQTLILVQFLSHIRAPPFVS